jgi:carbamoyltransferase
MKVLGISYQTHDSGVALVEDGKPLFAANEERYTRIKSDSAPPLLAIDSCFKFADITPKDIDVIALSGQKPWKAFQAFGYQHRKLLEFTHFRNIDGLVFQGRNKMVQFGGFSAILSNLIVATGVPQFIHDDFIPRKKIFKKLNGFCGEIEFVDHHTGHLSSAYYTSGIKSCLSLVIEGLDFENTVVIDSIKNGDINRVATTPWPHSPGFFYRLVTLILGFNILKHPGKITGLAGFGNPQKAYPIIQKLMWVENMELRVSPQIYVYISQYAKSRKVPKIFLTFSKEDLAAAFQKRLEDCIIQLLINIHKKHPNNNLIISGGVAANVKLNQRIHQLGLFDYVYIHPGMGDVGLALGSALRVSGLTNQRIGKTHTFPKLKDLYLGPDFSNEEIEEALKKFKLEYKYTSEIEKAIASLLAQNKVVARFSGRMEYGPRALGNRSILFSPIDSLVNNWLNKRLKRTEFMPFAPVILKEFASQCFDGIEGAEYSAQFMTICFDCTKWMMDKCPAVVHVDNTARPQIIDVEDNPSYYKIVDEFRLLTGLPCLINTSFNMHEEPIVCTPMDAIRSFMEGHLDYLAMGDYLVGHPSLIR